MSKRQLAMVIDLNQCMGCQSCTVACKTEWTNRNGREYMYWNNVETYPTSQGYPKNWRTLQNIVPSIEKDYGMPWDYNFEGIQKGELFQPDEESTLGINWDEDVVDTAHDYMFYLPRICNHCSEPSCLGVCPHDAVFKREKDGVVLIDLDKCQGCRYCVAACPYKKIYFNPKISKSEKCNMCFPRLEQGLEPACVESCGSGARFVGYLDDEASAVYALVKKHGVALGLHGEYNTKPNVYYIPPFQTKITIDTSGKESEAFKVPISELEKLFSKEVEQVVQKLSSEQKKYIQAGDSEVMRILLRQPLSLENVVNSETNESNSSLEKNVTDDFEIIEVE